jgi:hypothetical protein
MALYNPNNPPATRQQVRAEIVARFVTGRWRLVGPTPAEAARRRSTSPVAPTARSGSAPWPCSLAPRAPRSWPSGPDAKRPRHRPPRRKVSRARNGGPRSADPTGGDASRRSLGAGRIRSRGRTRNHPRRNCSGRMKGDDMNTFNDPGTVEQPRLWTIANAVEFLTDRLTSPPDRGDRSQRLLRLRAGGMPDHRPRADHDLARRARAEGGAIAANTGGIQRKATPRKPRRRAFH